MKSMKNLGKKVLGCCLVASPFVAIAAEGCMTSGFKLVAEAFGLTALIVTVVFVGFSLIKSANEAEG